MLAVIQQLDFTATLGWNSQRLLGGICAMWSSNTHFPLFWQHHAHFLGASVSVKLTHLWFQDKANKSHMAHHSLVSGSHLNWLRDERIANHSLSHNFYFSEKNLYYIWEKTGAEGLLKAGKQRRQSFESIAWYLDQAMAETPSNLKVVLLNYMSQ